MVEDKNTRKQVVWSLLETVKDPEIPVLSVVDLGVIRSVTFENGSVIVKITPTYSGCPAVDVIVADVMKALQAAGYLAHVELVLHPAWTTDWLSEKGKKALREYGIAPPLEATSDKLALLGSTRQVNCPNCGSDHTKMISQFGSTPCKALFRCLECQEPFDYFKCLK